MKNKFIFDLLRHSKIFIVCNAGRQRIAHWIEIFHSKFTLKCSKINYIIHKENGRIVKRSTKPRLQNTSPKLLLSLLLQMGCQSLDEFVRTNVFYCHTTGHLQRKIHTGNSRYEIDELDGLLIPVNAVKHQYTWFVERKSCPPSYLAGREEKERGAARPP